MQIKDNHVVSIHYSVKTQDGQEIDSSSPEEPLAFIQGSKYMILGLEEALYDRTSGDTFQVEVPPEKGYGDYNKNLVQHVPIAMFEGMDVEVGMSFRASTDDGEQSVIIIDKTDNEVTVDGNHPLAGHTLVFDVSIVDVQEATAYQLEHGLDCKKGCCG